MSDTEKIGRQERKNGKNPVMVYVPDDLKAYLEQRKAETGLSMSAYFVILLRKERLTK